MFVELIKDQGMLLDDIADPADPDADDDGEEKKKEEDQDDTDEEEEGDDDEDKTLG